MKNRFYILILCAACFTSCTEDLEIAPTDFVASEYYYTDSTQLDIALTGVYSALQDIYDEYMSVRFDISDETYEPTTASNRVGNLSHLPNNSMLFNVWRDTYQGIDLANKLIENIGKAGVGAAYSDNILGQAKFLRAYYYFVLVSNWGDVPFKTTSTVSVLDVDYERVSASEIYDFIVSEMEEAEGMVKDITHYNHAGRVTKSAIQGVLARVYLHMAGAQMNDPSGYQNSLEWSQKLINTGLHSLNPDYSQVFINLIQDKYDIRESIWEVEFYYEGATDIYNNGSRLGVINGIDQRTTDLGFGVTQFRQYPLTFDRYEPTDVRRDWNIAPFRYQGNNTDIKLYWTDTQVFERPIGKYRRDYELTGSKNNNFVPTNFPLLRYSDVLLMAAEAENEVNGPTQTAHAYLNEVRQRANASLFTDANVISDQETFRRVIQDERSRELCFEGLRRLDLIRWGIFVQRMEEVGDYVRANAPTAFYLERGLVAPNNLREYHVLFPIPERDIQLNGKLTQNQGY